MAKSTTHEFQPKLPKPSSILSLSTMADKKDPPTSLCPNEQVPTALTPLTAEIPSTKEVKTELALWTRNKKRKPEADSPAPPLKKKSKMKIGSWLKPNDADAWEIKKTLSSSDLENLLILETEFINDTVLPCLGDTLSKRVLSSQYGAKVTVHDRDFFSKHKIVLKRCGSSTKNFAFDEDWHKEFVKRRELKEGDEIVIGWYMPSNVPSKAL